MVCSILVCVSASRCVCLCLFYQQKLWLWRLALCVSYSPLLGLLLLFPFWQPLFFSLSTSFLCLSDYFLDYILSLSLAISAPCVCLSVPLPVSLPIPLSLCCLHLSPAGLLSRTPLHAPVPPGLSPPALPVPLATSERLL